MEEPIQNQSRSNDRWHHRRSTIRSPMRKTSQGLGPRVADLAPMMRTTRYIFFAFLLDALHLTKLPTCGWPLRPPPQPQGHAGEDNLEFEKISSMKSCLLPSAGMLEYYLARASTVCSPFINSHLHQSYILQQDWRPHQDFVEFCPPVSFSSSIRHTLFEFDDCLGGVGKLIAESAAASTKMYPGILPCFLTFSDII